MKSVVLAFDFCRGCRKKGLFFVSTARLNYEVTGDGV